MANVKEFAGKNIFGEIVEDKVVESSQSAELHKVESVQYDYSVSVDKDKDGSALAAVLQEENIEMDTEFLTLLKMEKIR